jgi:hypothetical protein
MNPRGAGEFRRGFPAAPRTVMLKPGPLARVWVMRVVTLPFLLVGLVLVLATLKRPLVLAFGSDAMGRIEQVKPYWTSRGHSKYFKLVFLYQLQGERQERGYAQVDLNPPAVGQTLPIRVLRIGDGHLAEPRDPNLSGSGPWLRGPVRVRLVWLGRPVRLWGLVGTDGGPEAHARWAGRRGNDCWQTPEFKRAIEPISNPLSIHHR